MTESNREIYELFMAEVTSIDTGISRSTKEPVSVRIKCSQVDEQGDLFSSAGMWVTVAPDDEVLERLKLGAKVFIHIEILGESPQAQEVKEGEGDEQGSFLSALKSSISRRLKASGRQGREEQIEICKILEFVANSEEKISISYAAREIFQLPENSYSFRYLLFLEECEVEPAEMAGAIRELLLEDEGER